MKDAAPISSPGPGGVPVIPTTRTGIGALLSSAPALMEKLTTLLDRLNGTLSDKNVAQFSGILANTNRATKNLADASPEVKKSLTQLQATLHDASDALAQFKTVAENANKTLDPNAPGPARQLAQTLKSAEAAADALHAEMDALKPATTQMTQSTLPEIDASMHDLRAAAQALRAMTQKLDDGGAGAVLGNPKLPEYKP